MDSYGGLLTYNGGWLDRAGGRRTDAKWLDELLKSPDTAVIPFWRDQCLVAGDPPVLVTLDATRADGVVFLGLDADGHGVFVTDLSGMEAEQAAELAGADRAVDVRAIVGALSPAQAATAGYGRGLLHWHRNQRFCGACGTATEPSWGGHQRICGNEACGRLHFPKIEPAVIMIVQTEREPERILLGRHRGSSAGRYSALAGFVEVGEGLEDAVRREVAEETGVRVGEVSYIASQAWPFPSGLMIGFRATAITEDITVDGDELLEARWFTRPELARYAVDNQLGRPDSIDRHLFRTWLAGTQLIKTAGLAGRRKEPANVEITLRDVRDSDLPAFWAQLNDEGARHMAAVTRGYHYDRAAFDAHWAKVRSDPAVIVRTVLAGGEVAGHAAVFGPPGEREVTYWVDRAYWGRGVASAALAALLGLEQTRPLHAHAAADNTGSIRVLQKCGFAITGRGRIFAQARGAEIDEVALTLA